MSLSSRNTTLPLHPFAKTRRRIVEDEFVLQYKNKSAPLCHCALLCLHCFYKRFRQSRQSRGGSSTGAAQRAERGRRRSMDVLRFVCTRAIAADVNASRVLAPGSAFDCFYVSDCCIRQGRSRCPGVGTTASVRYTYFLRVGPLKKAPVEASDISMCSLHSVQVVCIPAPVGCDWSE